VSGLIKSGRTEYLADLREAHRLVLSALGARRAVGNLAFEDELRAVARDLLRFITWEVKP
jgi:hypothetical protein